MRRARAQNAEVAALVGSTLIDVERIAKLYGALVITEEEWYGRRAVRC